MSPDRARGTLERRYRRLLLAYAPPYRAARGDEIVATLLDLAPPGRRTPRPGEVADLVLSGVRQRLGVGSIAGLDAGFTVAAPVALTLAAGISAYAWWRVEPAPSPLGGLPLFGEFRTLGPIAYACWLVAAVGRAILRPRLSRPLVAIAIAATLALPLLAPVTGIDRPPLWVLMALVGFGLIAHLGTGPRATGGAAPSTEERLSVAAGVVAVAVSASTVTLIWPPVGGGWGYYYQPTISRVGVVVGAAVASVAVIALLRLVQRRPAVDWLWATVLLGLPSGWLGPFDTAGLRLAADRSVPHFGRLAQVLLASCVAAAAMVWLAQRRSPGAPARPPAGRGSLAAAGVAALGCALGLAAFFVPAAVVLRGLPMHAVLTVGVLVVVGAVAGPAPSRRTGWGILATAAAALAGALVVAVYDNGWSTTGWTDLPHTVALVCTVSLVPLSACAVTAARVLRATGGVRAVGGRAGATAALCVGWLGYLTLPYVLSWGPVLLVLAACLVAVIASRRAAAP